MEKTEPIVIEKKGTVVLSDHRSYEIIGIVASVVSLSSLIPVTIDVYSNPGI